MSPGPANPANKNGAETGAVFINRLSIGLVVDAVGAAQRHAWVERGVALPERQHHHRRAKLDPVVQVDDILIGHADAAGGDRRTDVFWLVGAVDAIERVFVAR